MLEWPIVMSNGLLSTCSYLKWWTFFILTHAQNWGVSLFTIHLQCTTHRHFPTGLRNTLGSIGHAIQAFTNGMLTVHTMNKEISMTIKIVTTGVLVPVILLWWW